MDLNPFEITLRKMDLVWFLISHFSQNMDLITFGLTFKKSLHTLLCFFSFLSFFASYHICTSHDLNSWPSRSQEFEPVHQRTHSNTLLLYLVLIILSLECTNFYSLYNTFFLLTKLVTHNKTITTFISIWFENSFGSFIQAKFIL